MAVALMLSLICVSSFAVAEQSRLYFTPERVEIARQNIEQHEWAKQVFNRILHGPALDPHQSIVADAYISADRLANKTNDEVFALMPPIAVQRDDSGTKRLCPVHGEDVRKISGYRPWKLDFENHPWKVICPVGGEMYPSNDFAAGDMTSGDFPDDGNGIVVNGQRFQVIRYYAHMAFLHHVYPAIRSLAAAYVLTDEPRYAEKCAVLLAALAQNYPGPTYNSAHCFKGSYRPHAGLVTDSIWSCITVPEIAKAYDAIRPIYEQSSELIAYLHEKGLHGESPESAQSFVEDRIMRQAMQSLIDQAISGNPGFHQLAAITLALVIDDFKPQNHPNSLDMVRFTFDAGYAPARWVMSNYVTRDGGGFEGLAYDRFKFNYFEVARRMEELRACHPDTLTLEQFPRILDEPKARAMFDFYIDATAMQATLPEIGDTGGGRLDPDALMPQAYFTRFPDFYAEGFRIYRDPRYARAMLGLDLAMPQKADIFEPSIEQPALDALDSLDSTIAPNTRLLDHYGLAYLRGGNGKNARELVVNYSALKGHYQNDFLSLYLYAHELSMLPDLGYPFTWEYRWTWDANSYTHNTVTIDGTQPVAPPNVTQGWVSLIGDRDDVQVSLIAHDAYNMAFRTRDTTAPDVKRYERINVMIGEDETNAYTLDLFVVEGGKRHDQSWHSTLRPPTLPDLNWASQPIGTAAGPDIAHGTSYTNTLGKSVTDGLSYVTNVQRASIDKPAMFAWQYNVGDSIGMRMHIVPVDHPVELIYGTGRSPARPAEWQLPMLFVRHENDSQQTSRFLTVLEPHASDSGSRIKQIEVDSEREESSWPLTITVQRQDNQNKISRDVITINAPSNSSADSSVLDRGRARNASIRVMTHQEGHMTRDVVFRTSGPTSGVHQDEKETRIVNVDRRANAITINVSASILREAEPWIRIFSPGRSSIYRITKIVEVDETHAMLTLKESSLLGRVLPTGFDKGIIRNSAPLPFAIGRVDPSDPTKISLCRFTGARVERSGREASWRLQGVDSSPGIQGKTGHDLYLADPIDLRDIEATFGPIDNHSSLEIHDYGPGDYVQFMLH